MIAIVVVVAITGDVISAATAQVLNNKAEQNEPTITQAGNKATPTTAVASEQLNAQAGSSANNQRTEDQGWLKIATHQLPSTHDGNQMTLPLSGTLIHSTRGKVFDKQGAQSGAKAWHFTVDRDGQIYQHLSLNSVGIHAGPSEMILADGSTTGSVNSRTIGIELANYGGVVQFEGADLKPVWKFLEEPLQDCDKDNLPTFKDVEISNSLLSRMKIAGKLKVGDAEYDGYWEEYPSVQIDGLLSLLQAIQQSKWKAALNTIVPHSKVAKCPVGRKLDPGPLFPAEKLNEFNYAP
jgi:N-acetyl-anhydromuramyl-L-alanine amidase AmpD